MIRDKATRKRDSLAALSAANADCWIATAGPDGPHLVPLSLCWHAERVVLAVAETARTARDVLAGGTARIGVGPTRDVTMLDVVLDRGVPCGDAGELGEAYAAQADWDPRGAAGYVFLVLRPTRIQAWRESDEIQGRLLMRDGAWLV